MNSISTLTVTLRLSRGSLFIANSSFHTSSSSNSRIKRSHTHKPFFHAKKTGKHPDEPITVENKSFIQEMIKQNYGDSPLATYVKVDSESGSLLRPELQPWARGVWEEGKTKRMG